jgi:DNA invertase Pin-like site-specific DNA recombinase
MSINIAERLRLINQPKLQLKIIGPVIPLVYGYTRVSTNQQAKLGKSLDAQEEMIRKYCTDNNLKDPIIITDAGLSGKDIKNRPNFCEMRKALKNGDTLITYSLSRLGRSVFDMVNFIKEIEDKGIRLIVLEHNIDLTTAAGRMFSGMLMVIYQFEREIDSERISATLQSMKRENKLLTKAPYGFKIVNKALVENPDEMKLIDLIILYVHQDPNIKVAEICRRLQIEVDIGNIKLRKSNTVHQKVITDIIIRYNIRQEI